VSQCRVAASLLSSALFVILNVITTAVKSMCVSTTRCHHYNTHFFLRARLCASPLHPMLPIFHFFHSSWFNFCFLAFKESKIFFGFLIQAQESFCKYQNDSFSLIFFFNLFAFDIPKSKSWICIFFIKCHLENHFTDCKCWRLSAVSIVSLVSVTGILRLVIYISCYTRACILQYIAYLYIAVIYRNCYTRYYARKCEDISFRCNKNIMCIEVKSTWILNPHKRNRFAIYSQSIFINSKILW